MFHLPGSPSRIGASSTTPEDNHAVPCSRRSSFGSSSSSGASAPSTTPSSLASSPSAALTGEWTTRLAHEPEGTGPTDAFVHGLLKQRREADVALAAWRVRCETLEAEVGRLAVLLDKVEKERDEARKGKGEGKGIVEETVQPDSPSRASPYTSYTRSSGSGPCPVINPDLPMSKQAVPPCNAQFLLGRCDAPRCRYEHRYQLTPDQVEEIRRGAKHHVCNAIKHGLPCPDGQDCIFGHFCPRGPSCGRERCSFTDDQHLVIPARRPPLRRR